ncbi:MAG: hypothetical protein N2450_07020 [bacterium]|nr:hypothetical protein [bacterium]
MKRSEKTILCWFILSILLFSCSKKPPKQVANDFLRWEDLQLSEKEFVAEMYRLGIAIAYWQCKIAEWNCFFTKKELTNKQEEYFQILTQLHSICFDRIRMSERLANTAQLHWIDSFKLYFQQHTIQRWIEQPILASGEHFISDSTFFPRIEIVWGKSVLFYPFRETRPIPLWEYNPTTRCDSLWYSVAIVKEPTEIRSPMARLLESRWEFPKDTGYPQRIRWEKMVLTEFDHPLYQLGGIVKQTNKK